MTHADDDARPTPAVGAAALACDPAAASGCALCADEALRASVMSVDTQARMASVALLGDGNAGRGTADGAVIAAALDLVDGISVGDLVLVHQGFVISRVRAL